MPLDVELILPGEAEVSAAKRLLERVFCRYLRFFDVVVADALYMEAPFIDFCSVHKKHVITVLKEDRLILMQDAKGIFKTIEPEIFTEANETVRVWDAEGFTTAGTDKPLRVVYAQEAETKRDYRVPVNVVYRVHFCAKFLSLEFKKFYAQSIYNNFNYAPTIQ